MTNARSDNPNARSVLVLEDREYQKISTSPKSVELLADTQALIVPYSMAPDQNRALIEHIRVLLTDGGMLKAGQLLIRNPFEDEAFEPAAGAIESFASAKFGHMAAVAGLLGARRVFFENSEVDVQQSKRATTGKFGWLGSKGSGNLNAEVEERLKKKIQAEYLFQGSSPSPEEAIDYLRAHRLDRDPELQSLVKLRSGSNLMSAFTMNFNAIRESKSNLDCGADLALKLPSGSGNVGSTFAQQSKAIRNIEITTEIQF